MSDAVLVWGAGGHGKVVTDLARVCGHTVIGFVDSDATTLGNVVEPGGACVVIPEDELKRSLAAGTQLPRGARYVLLGIGDNQIRRRCLSALDDTLLSKALVHPHATVSDSTILGDASVVFAGAVINAGARLGRAVIINSGAVVEHDCVIADGVHISPNATLTGGVIVDEGAWVGAGAAILPGLRIGRRSIVGAGAVVIRNVPDDVTVVGNPARELARPELHPSH